VPAALDYIRAIAPSRPLFVEEPVPPEDVAGLAEVTARSDVPIASGERLIGRREFEPAIRARAFNIAQPDICHTGGLFEAKKIAAMAETAGIGLAPHNPLGPIAGVAALHFGISTPNVVIQEEMSGAVPWYDDVVAWPIVRKPGRWDVPTKPGLGLEVDEAVIASHPFQQEVLHARNAVLADGTVVDW
jgi:galactonate dehydratase